MSRLASIALICLTALPVSGQVGRAPDGGCADGRISFVFIDNNSIFDTSDPDLDSRFRWAYNAANALHVRTRQWVIRRELLFRPGDCFDPFLLDESERLLRAYPFLAQVDIYGIPQPDSTHHVLIDTHDDWSTRVDVRVKLDDGFHFEGVRLSELNFLGMGQTLGVFWQQRDVTRDYGVSYWAPQIGRSRWDLSSAVGRTRAGTFFREQVGYPFVGEVGRWAGRESFVRDEQFFDYILSDDEALRSPHVLVPIRDKRFEASVLRRFGERGLSLLAGAGLSSRELSYPGPIEIAPQGDFDERFAADSATARPVMDQTFERKAIRFHLLVGLRDVRWIERRGLDGMHGDEDVRLGFEAGLDVGRSLPAFGDDDATLAGLIYGATELGGSILIGRGRLDATRAFPAERSGSDWEDVYAGLELFGYLRGSPQSAHTLLARVDAAGAWNTRTPFQLTLGGERGVRGYDLERFPGGRRVVLTLEERLYLGWPFGRLYDTGLSLFADAGRLWGGDVPFGQDSGWRASMGTGLRFAFPAGSRLTYRFDLAWPLERSTGLNDVRIRFSIGEPIGFSNSNNDLQFRRSRKEGVAADLFRFTNNPGS